MSLPAQNTFDIALQWIKILVGYAQRFVGKFRFTIQMIGGGDVAVIS